MSYTAMLRSTRDDFFRAVGFNERKASIKDEGIYIFDKQARNSRPHRVPGQVRWWWQASSDTLFMATPAWRTRGQRPSLR